VKPAPKDTRVENESARTISQKAKARGRGGLRSCDVVGRSQQGEASGRDQ
jgi:hypothetical protein